MDRSSNGIDRLTVRPKINERHAVVSRRRKDRPRHFQQSCRADQNRIRSESDLSGSDYAEESGRLRLLNPLATFPFPHLYQEQKRKRRARQAETKHTLQQERLPNFLNITYREVRRRFRAGERLMDDPYRKIMSIANRATDVADKPRDVNTLSRWKRNYAGHQERPQSRKR